VTRWRIYGLVLMLCATLGIELSSTPPVSATIPQRLDVDPEAGIMNLEAWLQGGAW